MATNPKPKSKSPPKSTAENRISRARYFKERRLKARLEKEVEHWSVIMVRELLTSLPLALGAIDNFTKAYKERTVALASANYPIHSINQLSSPHQLGGAELIDSPVTVDAPAGMPAFCVGKYPDDPTGEKETPLFTLDVELTDDCQAYFRDHFPDEMSTIREYNGMPEPLKYQMMRSMFKRLGLVIPADEPDKARKFYPSLSHN